MIKSIEQLKADGIAVKPLLSVLFLIVSLSYGYFYWAGDCCQNTRLDLTRAISEDHSFLINRFSDNTGDFKKVPILPQDQAKYEGLPYLAYSNKVPGLSFMGIPTWAIGYVTLKVAGLEEWKTLTWAHYITTFITVGLPSAAGVCLFYLWLMQVSQRPKFALLIALGLGIGSPYFAYAVRFQPHSVTASLLFFSFYVAWSFGHGFLPEKSKRFIIALAGFALGYSVLLEYPAALPAVAIFIYALMTFRSVKFGTSFAIGAAVPAVLLLFYNLSVSGHVIFATYTSMESEGSTYHLRNPTHFFSWPSLAVISKVLFGSQRGLMHVAPWMMLGFVGFYEMKRQKELRREAILFLVILLSMLVFYSFLGGKQNLWAGSFSMGPRHLIPVFPFLAAGLIFLPRRMGYVAAPLVLYAIFVTTAATAVNPAFGAEQDPLYEYALPHFLEGHYPRIMFSGSHTFVNQGLVPGYLSWNWGLLAGLKGPWQPVPLYFLWYFGITYLIVLAGTKKGIQSGSEDQQEAEYHPAN